MRIIELRRLAVSLAAAGLLTMGLAGAAAAQDTSSAGNGGTASSDADGGAVTVGDTNSGAATGGGTVVAVPVDLDNLAATIIASITGGEEADTGDAGGTVATETSDGSAATEG